MKSSDHNTRTLFEPAAAGLLLALFLLLAYGPAKLEGHSIYHGVIQDVTNLYGFSSWDEFSRAELAAGRFPLWNPHNGFGVPHLANMQTALFYPLNFVKWGYGFFSSIDFLLLLRLWLAGLFTWLLLRRALSTGFFAAMLGAVSFMLTGYLTRYVYMSHLNVEILLPLQILLMHRLASRPGPGPVIASGAGFALLVLGGFPEASLYAVSFAAAFYIFAAGPSRKSFVLLGAGLGVGLFLSSLQWLPFTEYFAQAWTYHDAESGLRGFDPRLMISLILPWLFGDNRLSPASPFLSPHLGVIPVLLALYFSLRIKGCKRESGFFIIAAIALMGLIYQVPPFCWLARLFPFSHTYNYKYAAPALALCVSVLAGLGAHRLGRPGKRRGFFIAGSLVLAWLAACVVIGLPPWHGFRPYYALGLLTPGIVAAAVSLVVIALALAFLRSRELISGRALGIGLLALAAVGLLYDQLGYRPVYHDDLKARAGKAADHLAGMSKPGRVYADPELKDFFSNLLLPQGIDDLRYYDPLYPRTYVEFMAAVNELGGDTLMAHYKSHMLFALEPGRVGHPLLALADVRAYLLSTRIDERPLMREWLSSALVINDRRESWLRHAEFVSGGDKKAGLMEHAPVLVRGEAPVRVRATSQLLFAAAIPDDQVAPEGDEDGVQFIVLRSGAEEKSLLFSRFLDPGRADQDAGWHPYALNLDGPEIKPGPDDDQTIALSLLLLPGPRDNRLRDAAVWGLLRARSGERPGGIVLHSADRAPPYLYEDTNAYPRAWRVQGLGRAPAGMDFMEAVKRVAAANPDAFRAVSVIPSHLVVSMEDDEAEVAKPRLELKSLPGRIEITSESSSSGFLQIQVQHFPGWRAFARSGEQSGELRILPANGPFMALPAPAGAWNFELIYQPWAFRIGLWASLAALAATAAGWFWGALKLRKGAGARAPG